MPDDSVPFTWQELLPHEVTTRMELALLRHRKAALDHLAHGREKVLAELLAGAAFGGRLRVLRPIRAQHPHQPVMPPPDGSPMQSGDDGSHSVVRFPRRPR
jgi:hypothetical protein